MDGGGGYKICNGRCYKLQVVFKIASGGMVLQDCKGWLQDCKGVTTLEGFVTCL